jgi:hypothetical protein
VPSRYPSSLRTVPLELEWVLVQESVFHSALPLQLGLVSPQHMQTGPGFQPSSVILS